VVSGSDECPVADDADPSDDDAPDDVVPEPDGDAPDDVVPEPDGDAPDDVVPEPDDGVDAVCVEAVVAPTEPVAAITPQASTNVASVAATTRRRIVAI
jgi:hypothetical protein